MKFELCTDSLEGALVASEYPFTSIELCQALSVGGLTPNMALVEACADQSTAEVHSMIRHLEGNFVYEDSTIDVMVKDINYAAQAGATGVVFGALDGGNRLAASNKKMVEAAKMAGLACTFHRAFDFAEDPYRAMDTILNLGFDRLLTSGQQQTAEKGLYLIGDLQRQFGNEIQLIAGSGVNDSNAKLFEQEGVDYLHFTARKPSDESIVLGMGEVCLTDRSKIDRITVLF